MHNSLVFITASVLGNILANSCFAGIYITSDTPAPFPCQWRGYLLEHRAVRLAAVPGNRVNAAHPLREQYLRKVTLLEASKPTSESPIRIADHVGMYVRLGNYEKAVQIARAAPRSASEHFAILANHTIALWESGNTRQAIEMQQQVVRSASAADRDYENFQLKWMIHRAKNPKETLLDPFAPLEALMDPKVDLLKLDQEKLRKNLPDKTLPHVQQLALTFPRDGRLLWMLGELAFIYNDIRTSAAILDGCVTEFALGDANLRQHRTLLRAEADRIANLPDKDHQQYRGVAMFRSFRPTVRKLDSQLLPEIRPNEVNELPWMVVNETIIKPPFEPNFHSHLQQLDQKKVALTGYMRPLTNDLEVGGFMLLEFPVGCWFCETPEPTAIIYVELPLDKSVTIMTNRVRVTGTLRLNKDDPEDFIYSIDNALISRPD
ncbi:MAG: DUF3299 domain-containing protein [Zavarzinella sp.]